MQAPRKYKAQKRIGAEVTGPKLTDAEHDLIYRISKNGSSAYEPGEKESASITALKRKGLVEKSKKYNDNYYLSDKGKKIAQGMQHEYG